MASASPTQPKPAPETVKADTTLVQKVAYPAFFAKIASVGITPANEKVAAELIALSDVVTPAVHRAVNRILGEQESAQFDAVKSAADAARLAAGIPVTVPTTETNAVDFLIDPDVKQAAAVMVAEQIKQANLANLITTPTAAPGTEEDEEEKKKKMTTTGSC